MEMQCLLTVESFNRKGRKFDELIVPMQSYVIGWIDVWAAQFRQGLNPGPYPMSTTGGSIDPHGINEWMKLNFGDSLGLNGIVVGTDSTPVALEDYALGTLIAHGIGAGQLEYGESTVSAPTIISSTARLQCQRLFTNNSGGSITVREAGIYAGFGARVYLVARDVFTKVILNTDSATMTYTLQVTV